MHSGSGASALKLLTCLKLSVAMHTVVIRFRRRSNQILQCTPGAAPLTICDGLHRYGRLAKIPISFNRAMVNFFAALHLCPKGVKDVHDMLVRYLPAPMGDISPPARMVALTLVCACIV